MTLLIKEWFIIGKGYSLAAALKSKDNASQPKAVTVSGPGRSDTGSC